MDWWKKKLTYLILKIDKERIMRNIEISSIGNGVSIKIGTKTKNKKQSLLKTVEKENKGTLSKYFLKLIEQSSNITKNNG